MEKLKYQVITPTYQIALMNILMADEIRGRPTTILSTIFFSHLLSKNIKNNIYIILPATLYECET
jgi:hypothetical protein